MEIIKFYDREEELKILEKVKNPIAIIYGKRRVGKNYFSFKICENKDIIFFVNLKNLKTY